VELETRYGFIHEKIDIKILILFLLSRLPDAVDPNRLTEMTTQCDDGISYFDYTDCVSELEHTGHIQNIAKGYIITEKGKQISEITDSGLPYSVRVKAEKLASKASEELRRDSMIHTSHTVKTRGGNMVKLSMSDGVSEIIKLELLSANEAQSVKIEDNFRRNAEAVYLKLIQMLTDGEIN